MDGGHPQLVPSPGDRAAVTSEVLGHRAAANNAAGPPGPTRSLVMNHKTRPRRRRFRSGLGERERNSSPNKDGEEVKPVLADSEDHSLSAGRTGGTTDDR